MRITLVSLLTRHLSHLSLEGQVCSIPLALLAYALMRLLYFLCLGFMKELELEVFQ